MQTGILITDGIGNICAKCVYAGDVSTDTMNTEITRLQTKYPSYIVIFYTSDQDSVFVNAIVNTPFPNSI